MSNVTRCINYLVYGQFRLREICVTLQFFFPLEKKYLSIFYVCLYVLIYREIAVVHEGSRWGSHQIVRVQCIRLHLRVI